MASETTNERQAAPAGVEALAGAFLLVLGLQAWRAGVYLLPDAGPGAMFLVPCLFAAVPLGRAVGRTIGVRRGWALLLLALALLRLTVQVAGPPLVGWLATVGVALFAAAAELWVTARRHPFVTGQALAAGVALNLIERMLSDTYDWCWQTGPGPLALCALIVAPAVVVALLALTGEAGGAPRQTPAAAALPLFVVALQLAVVQPARTTALTGAAMPWVFCLSTCGTLLAVPATWLLGHQLPVWLRSRTAGPVAVRAHHLASALGLAIVVPGLWLRPLAIPALLVGPTLALGFMAVVLQARPIGRRRRVGDWSSLQAWWLAAAISAVGGGARWPAVVALGVLCGLAATGLVHHGREEQPTPGLGWPLAVHPLALVVALITLTRPGLPRGDLAPALDYGGLRVATLNLDGARTATGRPSLQDELAQLRLLDAEIVGLRGLPTDPRVFWDVPYWLGLRLGQRPVRLPRAPALAFLAPAVPAERAVVGPQAIVARWRVGAGSLGVGLLDTSAAPELLANAAAARLGAEPPWLLLGYLGGQTPLPEGLRRLPLGLQAGAGEGVAVSERIDPVPTSRALSLHRAGASALIHLQR